ncbi:MAG: DUF3667 domain-containing protein [Bacteroidota bacterium]
MDDSSPDLCAACRHPLTGEFCSACGERRARPEDESFRHFLVEAVGVFTSADSKLWRSFRALFVPGKLTAEHFAGRRGLYLHPVRLFLILNVVFFFALSSAGGTVFRGPLDSQRGSSLYGETAVRATDAQLRSWNDSRADEVSPEVYEAAFNQQADTLAPSLIALLVPLIAMLLALALWPVRASIVRHVVFAAHAVAAFMAVLLVLLFSVSLVVFALSAVGIGSTSGFSIDPIAVPLTIVAVVLYYVTGIRRVYEVPWWGAIVSGLAVSTAGMYAALVAFRFLLFWATVWTLDPPPAG